MAIAVVKSRVFMFEHWCKRSTSVIDNQKNVVNYECTELYGVQDFDNKVFSFSNVLNYSESGSL